MLRHLILCGSVLAVLGTGQAQAFDTETFRENRRPDWCLETLWGHRCEEPRAGMWKEVREALQPGMSEAEVLALLGPADGIHERHWVYDMGLQLIDHVFLELFFNEEGILVEILEVQG